MSDIIPLIQMKPGNSGTVLAIEGGFGLTRRLEALGIRVGQNLTMVSSAFSRGPVTVRVGNLQVALGFGMARRVIVQLERQIPE
jgi:ferrous iron transport protein A